MPLKARMFRGMDVGVQVFLWQHSLPSAHLVTRLCKRAQVVELTYIIQTIPFFEGFEEWQKDANQKIHNLNVGESTPNISPMMEPGPYQAVGWNKISRMVWLLHGYYM